MSLLMNAQTPRPGGFPSTHWSSIFAASSQDTEAGLKALGKLLSRYQPALTSYLEKKFFYNPEEAKDILHDFILNNVLKKDLISKIKPMKGYQFRRFLLCSLHTFTVSDYRRKTALKRKPRNGLTSLDEIADTDATLSVPPQSEEFDIAWAKTVISEALRRMHEDCKASSRLDIWGVFENRLLRPLLEGKELQPYEQLVQEFGFKSPAQAHNVLVTAKRAFARCLEQVVGEYAAEPSAVQQEIRELQLILCHAK
jgi:hypothetical protein